MSLLLTVLALSLVSFTNCALFELGANQAQYQAVKRQVTHHY